MKKITNGRDKLNDFAPDFARYNDDILFGEVWANAALAPHERSLITISALMGMALFPQLKNHMILGKENGVTKEEISTLITQLAFYTGWPKAWTAFNMAKEIWTDIKVEGD
ncbi:MAG: carboxymuconolactone decarboxylase family protein [Lactococcus sp.]